MKIKNIEFGVDLEILMSRYPHSKVFGALKMAVRNLKRGNPAPPALIMGDWDKYGYGYDEPEESFAKELKTLCIKYGIMNEEGRFI